MNDDLIKRSDAIGAITNHCENECCYRVENWCPQCQREEFQEAIKAVPSADRPQGEWVRTGRTNIYGGIEVQCSNCGDKVMVQHLEDEWYCRHCGADMGMKGADDE